MQDDLLDTTLTVKENMIAHGILFDLTVKVAAEKAEQLLKFVGLSHYQNKATTSLSGGMRRRLVLARALINDPKLIILDEPTTGLDIQSRHHHDRLRLHPFVHLIITRQCCIPAYPLRQQLYAPCYLLRIRIYLLDY